MQPFKLLIQSPTLVLGRHANWACLRPTLQFVSLRIITVSHYITIVFRLQCFPPSLLELYCLHFSRHVLLCPRGGILRGTLTLSKMLQGPQNNVPPDVTERLRMHIRLCFHPQDSLL